MRASIWQVLVIASVLVHLGGCECGAPIAPPGDGGTPDARPERDAGPRDDAGPEIDAGPEHDGGREHDGGPAGDASPPDASRPPDGGPAASGYRVVEGDCELLWEVETVGVPVSVRDHDGDGKRDVLEHDQTRIRIRAGRDGSVLRTLDPPTRSGYDTPILFVLEVPDTTADGIADLAVAQLYTEPAPPGDVVVSPGEIGATLSLLSGDDGARVWQRDYPPRGEGTSPGLGSIAAGADADGDGAIDLLVGEPTWDAPEDGALVIVSGRSGATLARHPRPAGVHHYPGELVLLRADPLAVAVGGSEDEVPDPHVVLGMRPGATALDWTFRDMPGDFSRAAGAIDIDGDGWADPIVNHRDRWLPSDAQGVLTAIDGRTGAVRWTTEARHVINGHWGVGFAITADADDDGIADVAAGTSHSLPNLPLINVPGHFTIVGGADGHYIAEVTDADTGGDEQCDFGAHIAALDDPTERGGAAVAVTHRQSVAPDTLTAWSCLAEEP